MHLRRWLVRRTFPRAEMALMLSFTGLAGFLTSALLLHLGVDALSIRYAIAVLVAYGAFVLLVRGWIARQLYSLVETAKLAGVDPREYLAEATRRAIANPGTVTLPRDLLSN